MSPIIKSKLLFVHMNLFSHRHRSSCEKLDVAGKCCSCMDQAVRQTHSLLVFCQQTKKLPGKEMELLYCQSKDCWCRMSFSILRAHGKGAITFLCFCIPSKED